MKLLLSSVSGLVLLAAPGSLHAQAADAAVDRAVAAYKAMRTMRGTFEQTINNPVTGSVLVSRGEFARRHPNLLSIRFTDPQGDRIVMDGEAVWVYLPSSTPGQVIKLPPSATGGGVDITAELLDSPRQRFRITDGGAATVSGRSTRVVTLVPLARQHIFTRATVWIDDADGIVRQFEVQDHAGVTRRFRVLTMQRNPQVPDTEFRFTPPRGVPVFDQTGAGRSR